ncbi:MAG: hypothetical protein LBH46_01855 [Rickettsiales bacterium]|jgi:diaminopimelate epimerase|nr:hypothetical protein [Rickettsiales bacterium]
MVPSINSVYCKIVFAIYHQRMINYTLISPSGNDTIIVNSPVSRDEQREISLLLLDKHKNAEQVGFLEQGGKRLQMAGGEFCCNASRAFGFFLLEGRDGKVEFEVSGTTFPVICEVKNEKSKIKLDVNLSFNDLIEEKDGATLVKLDGIVHLVIENTSLLYKDADKDYANFLLEEFGLKREIASGILFVDENKLTPFVYVKKINTLYAETACGSGSIATAIYKTYKNYKTTNNIFNLRQPSGQSLEISLIIENNFVESAFVDGKVKILENGMV